MKQAEWMDQLVYDLIEHYEAEVLSSGLLYLELGMDDFGVLVIEEKIKHKQISVCYWLYDAQSHPVAEPELLFYLDEGGEWIPYEIRCHTVGHQAYAQLDEMQGELIVTDPASQENLAAFADFWAEVLRGQGWVGGALKAVTQPHSDVDYEDAPEELPSVAALWGWVDEYGQCQATDGCWCDPEGACEHGHRS